MHHALGNPLAISVAPASRSAGNPAARAARARRRSPSSDCPPPRADRRRHSRLVHGSISSPQQMDRPCAIGRDRSNELFCRARSMYPIRGTPTKIRPAASARCGRLTPGRDCGMITRSGGRHDRDPQAETRHGEDCRAGTRLSLGLRQRACERGARPARCRKATTRRSKRRWASMPSRSAAPPSPRPRPQNRRTWIYRIRPSVMHSPSGASPTASSAARLSTRSNAAQPAALGPAPAPRRADRFRRRARHHGRQWRSGARSGVGIHIYVANRSMGERFFYQRRRRDVDRAATGRLCCAPSLAFSTVAPGEIAVVPRGIKFRVELPDGAARGYVCENYGALLRLPELGPHRRQRSGQPARLPHARRRVRGSRRRSSRSSRSSSAICGRPTIDHSPLDVVAWHGNYAPYKYDLARFNAINTVSFDHPDPSIFTVLTSPTDRPAPPTWISSSSRRAGWSPSTPSARPGSTATS